MNLTPDQPKSRKWTPRKVIVTITAGIFITCCGLTSLITLLPAPSEQEATAVSQQNRAEEIAFDEDESDPTATRQPTDTPHATATIKPTTTRAAASPTPQKASEQITALVVGVTDGDTIDVEIEGTLYHLRYIGMDTPERGQPFAEEATEANRRLVEGKTVILIKDISESDPYGRLLRYVYLENGTFVNAELVRTGFAVAANYPPDTAYAELFAQLQQEAQQNSVGRWADAAAQIAIVPTASVSATTPTAIPQPSNTPTPQPAATQPPAPTATLPPPTEPPAAAPGNVQISFILYDGAVSRVESDEYAVITNSGGSPVNIGGWRLNAGAPGQDYTFPGFDLQPGQSCRVYTNESHPDTCGFSFGSGQAIWNNDGDCGNLFDNNGAQISQYCY